MCLSVLSACMQVDHGYAWCLQTSVSYTLELELGMAGSLCVGAGKLACALSKNKHQFSSPSGFHVVAFVGFVTATEAGFSPQGMSVEV